MNIKFNFKRKKIQDIKIGEVVKTLNIKNEKIEIKRVIDTFLPIVKKEDQRRINFSDGYIINSYKHPILVKRNGKLIYIETELLEVGDICIDSENRNRIIKSITYENKDEQFYDLEVQDNNNFFAGFENTYCGHNSSNANYPWFHYEIELICQLGNAKGTEDTRVRHMDHTIIFNKFFLERALNHQDITLFHMNVVPDLFESLGDYDKFKELYEKYEKSVPKKNKKVINAYDLLELFISERFLQGRVYCTFADNIDRGPWKQHDYIVNLCVEILLKQTPLDSELPEIAVCILAGINHGNVSDDRIPIIAEILVRFLDNMIDYMDYSDKEIEYSAKKRRTLGIGDSDIFHFLAKNKKFYNTVDGRDLLHERIELTSYSLYNASIELAKEKGPCELFNDTKYADGWLPIDTYCKNVDSLLSTNLKLDWELLREKLIKYGIRNSTLKATPPFGNSAKVSNSTSGAEPPRFLATTKEDKNFKITQLVPEYTKLKNYYTTAWGEDFNNIDYFKFISIIQKFTDQSISTNQYTNLMRYNGKVPLDVLIEEFLVAYKYGLKSLYYENFRSDDDADGVELEENKGCASGGCIV